MFYDFKSPNVNSLFCWMSALLAFWRFCVWKSLAILIRHQLQQRWFSVSGAVGSLCEWVLPKQRPALFCLGSHGFQRGWASSHVQVWSFHTLLRVARVSLNHCLWCGTNAVTHSLLALLRLKAYCRHWHPEVQSPRPGLYLKPPWAAAAIASLVYYPFWSSRHLELFSLEFSCVFWGGAYLQPLLFLAFLLVGSHCHQASAPCRLGSNLLFKTMFNFLNSPGALVPLENSHKNCPEMPTWSYAPCKHTSDILFQRNCV